MHVKRRKNRKVRIRGIEKTRGEFVEEYVYKLEVLFAKLLFRN